MPAFALTSPWAGSDAAAIPDSGIVCKGEWQGREVIGMRVSWDKRYITLAPVCTLLGLAFRLYDPDGLLGNKKDLGITCALVPHDHPGVDTGRRHFPLNAMFMNGPTRGQDVFMPLDFIIGGPAMAGQGWRMLMECLAAGRSISLPSSNTGMSKLTARAVGAYARVRSQFRTPVGKFEGVEEALARIGGHTYMMDAARSMTAGAVDLGEKPSVVSAIVKYHVTERARQVVNDGMDVIGGKGICLGPSNFLGRAYQQIPIGITVEGANILTRSLIIFGQGAIRCHPYVLAEMQAAQSPDRKQGLHDFDRAFWGHVGFVTRNKLRALGTSLTGGRWVGVNADVAPEMKRYYQLLSRYSAAFALLADTSMLVLGGSLKRRERLSARLGDILSQMYLVSATLKRFEDEGRQASDAPLAHWSIQDALFRLQDAFEGVLQPEQRVLDRPVGQRRVAGLAAFVFEALERGADQVHLRQDVAQARRQALAALQAAAQHQHRGVGQQGEGGGITAEQLVVALHLGCHVGIDANPAAAGQGRAQRAQFVACHETDMAPEGAIEVVQALLAVRRLGRLHLGQHIGMAADRALAEDDQAAGQDVGAFDGDADGNLLVGAAQEVGRSQADALAADDVHAVVDDLACAFGDVVFDDG